MRQHKKPCNDCPFRRASVKGWTGAAMPESFLVSLLITEQALPCHKKIDYSDPEWLKRFEADTTGRRCAGSMIMASNLCKRPRDKRVPILPANHELVFSSPREFVDHHRGSILKSWDEEPVVRDGLRTYLGLAPLEEIADD